MLDAGKLRSVGSLDTVGQSSRAAEVGRAVAESRSRSQVDVPVLRFRWYGRVVVASP